MGGSRGEPGRSAALQARRRCSLLGAHHWIIESAAGPLSRGTCRVCGEERLFRNHLQWSEVVPAGRVDDRREASAVIDPLERVRSRPFQLPRALRG